MPEVARSTPVYYRAPMEYIKIIVEEIALKNRARLLIEKKESESHVEVLLHLKAVDKCQLHWGLSRTPGSLWHVPPENVWPGGSRAYDRTAVRTPFISHNGDGRVFFKLDRTAGYSNLVFAFFYPDTGKWDNNHGNNYIIPLPVINKRSSLPSSLKEVTKGRNVLFEETFVLGEEGSLAAAVCKDGNQYEVFLISDVTERLTLHWGAALKSRYEWKLPPEPLQPAGSVVYDDKSVRTPFTFRNGTNRLAFRFSEDEAPLGITFVLKMTKEDRWLKSRNRNIFVPLTHYGKERYPELSELAKDIIHGETGDHGWTLMHRFNLCHDLMDGLEDNAEGLSMIYVWMRYSVIRQLDWQRNYNTKPSELSHAQDRLTLKIADIYKSRPEGRDLLRLIMSTLGRGGEGQRIRDDILHIMHRHHIKEVSGHFIEQWHQKLHNNATPDDIVICEAYLEFLRSNGDRDLFYKTLEAGGVSRERMESFERPITMPPDFIPHLKDGLIHDFGDYLKLLKSIHLGTDLETAINAARHLLDGETGGLLDFIRQHMDAGGEELASIAEKTISVRLALKESLNIEGDTGKVRDMLFLDLALEDFIRIAIERNIHEMQDEARLADLLGITVWNVLLSYDDDDLSACIREWEHLQGLPRFSEDWSLHAYAVLERAGRATSTLVDGYYQLFQPKAEYLGAAFRAEQWTINIFSEEVVRGMPAFVLSMIISRLEPRLRRHAKLGDWQVVSPGRAAGWLEVAESLGSVQGRQYGRPSIIIADKVSGYEEPPEGVTAIITPDTVDLVSHLAVRARNANLLFATCYDRDRIDHLKSLRGHILDLKVTVSGDVEFEEAKEGQVSGPPSVELVYEKKALPAFSGYAVSSGEFNSRIVGGKSNNLKALENQLPGRIHLPVSVALPFGVFDKVLDLKINSEIAGKYRGLLASIEGNPEETLAELRSTVLDLNAPEDLILSLQKTMVDSGLQWPDKREDIWTCIKHVWASKWNERAHLSRAARRISHEDIFMAVLIQQVVDAEYAFVIHTFNPITGDNKELYAEVVPGLGETIVGNYPGRAFSFISNKNRPEHIIRSYPGKSTGLFGDGLIFRSDSNAEDLEGYAGAGLYDSIILEPPREKTLDYTGEELICDKDFQKEIMSNITEIGTLIEECFGSPQDIEGAYSGGKYYVLQTRPQVGLKGPELNRVKS